MPIPTVPEVLKRSELMADNRELYRRPYMVPIAMDYDSVSLRSIDMLKIGNFGICGRSDSGRSNFIRLLLNSIRLNIFNSLTKAYIIDDGDMKLESCGDYGFVEKYSVDAEETAEIFADILDELKARQQTLIETKKSPDVLFQNEPLILLVINNRGVYDKLNQSKEMAQQFEEISKTYSRLKVLIIFSAIANTSTVTGVLRQIREDKKMFMFDDASNFHFINISTAQMKENAKPIKLGDAFMAFGSSVVRIKTILDD